MVSILITGVTSGIGKALSLNFLNEGHRVIGVGRDLSQLQTLKQNYSSNFDYIQADISKIEDRDNIIQFIKNREPLSHVAHNAGEINPICSIKEIKLEDYRYQHRVNTEAPLFLTQELLQYVTEEARFLFVTSGAGFSPYKGLATYSISKAATEMIWKTFQQEYKNEPYYFSGVRPGGVNTNIVSIASKVSPLVFPAVTQLKEKMKTGALLEPSFVAKFIQWILLSTTNAEFEKSWNINDEQHKQQWLESRKG